ncbi:heme biosynthesis protein HemY [Rhodobacteraceae bacterium WD3A24]|nr:heme biosynthesis protein HemY [Rhodobacteraceae bacterium WD3A24]
MIWSLLKILLFVAAVAGLTLAAAQLLDTGGAIRVTVGDIELLLGPFQAVVLVLVLLLALWLVLKIAGFAVAVLRFVNGDETAISRFFSRNRERRGFEALAEAMIALAGGEGARAATKAAKADKLLGRPDLTNLITAQAAELEGDRPRAEEYYKRLLPEERTRFVGVRGLMRQKLDAGDTETALKLAEKAFALRPGHGETQETLLRLQADTGDWQGARATLQARKRAGALPRDVYKRRDAVLALQQARKIFEDGRPVHAHEAAIEANRLSPDLVPAAALVARGYIREGRKRNAARVLKKAWAAQPHPDLAAAFAEIAPDEDANARLARFEALVKQSPEHEESRLLRAELLIAAEDFPAARRALGDLVERHPTARALTIMAAIERGEGSEDAVVRGWLTRALSAPRGPQWVCDNCRTVHGQWAAVCSNCGGIDTLSWREPSAGDGLSPTGTEMLPLLVNAPQAPRSAGVEPVADAPAEPAEEAETDSPEESPEPESRPAEEAQKTRN